MPSFFLAILLLPASYGADAPLWPGSGQIAPGPTTGALSAGGGKSQVMPFALAERDHLWSSLDLTWRPADPIQISLEWRVLGARFPDGTALWGPGDLKIATQARLFKSAQGSNWRPDLWGFWAIKLPNADAPLGTNETDSSYEIWLRDQRGALSWAVGGGLLIAGHPHQVAAQDDALVLHARASWELEAFGAHALGLAEWRVQSARNPGDASLGLGWEQSLGSMGFLIGGQATVGLTPAAADFGGSLWLGLVPAGEGA